MAFARQVKQAVKKYVTGTPRVQSKGGKVRYSQSYNGVSDVLAILNYANSLEPNNYGRVAKK